MSTEKGPMLEEGDFTTITASGDDDVTIPLGSLNHDVIGHVCKFLGIKDIKNCRLVSSLWNYGCTPVLKAKSRTKLELSPRYDKHCNPSRQDLGGWDISDVVEKLNFRPVNIYLAIPSTSRYILPPVDIAIFPSINNLKSIRVQYPVTHEFPWQKELSTKMILSSPTTLEELDFTWLEDEHLPYQPWRPHHGASLVDFPLLEGTVFPKLTTLRVHPIFQEDGAVRIGQAVTALFPKLKNLSTNCANLGAILEERLLPNFPRSLNCLEVVGNFDPTRLESLLELPVNLKNLYLGDGESRLTIDDREEDELPEILYELLNKHAPTLEELRVHMRWLHEGEILEWKFPVFPVLKKLDIHNCDLMTTVVFETDLGSGDFGAINYATCFPVLEVLNISTDRSLASRKEGVESFLPSKTNRQVVESVKEVDVKTYERDDIRGYVGIVNQAKIYMRLLHLFPNSRDSILQNLERVLHLEVSYYYDSD